MSDTELKNLEPTIARLEDLISHLQSVIEEQNRKLLLYTPVPWQGGECPVEDWCQVLIFTRGVGAKLVRAANVNWQHAPEGSLESDFDIVAYLVISRQNKRK